MFPVYTTLFAVLYLQQGPIRFEITMHGSYKFTIITFVI